MWLLQLQPSSLRSCMHTQSLSHVRLFATPWTVACQATLFMGFYLQWAGIEKGVKEPILLFFEAIIWNFLHIISKMIQSLTEDIMKYWDYCTYAQNHCKYNSHKCSFIPGSWVLLRQHYFRWFSKMAYIQLLVKFEKDNVKSSLNLYNFWKKFLKKIWKKFAKTMQNKHKKHMCWMWNQIRF